MRPTERLPGRRLRGGLARRPRPRRQADAPGWLEWLLTASDRLVGIVRSPERHRRDVLADRAAFPPDAGLAMLLSAGEAVEEQPRPDVGRACAVERVATQEATDRPVAAQQLLQERDEPALAVRRRERQEPHQPVETEVVRRDLWWSAARIAGLADELILLPVVLVGRVGRRPLDHDLVSLAADAAEGAVGVDEVIAVEAVVHQLAAAEQVPDRPVAEDRDGDGQRDRRAGEENRRRIERRCGERDDEPVERVGHGRERGEHRHDVEPGVVAGHDEIALCPDHDERGDTGNYRSEEHTSELQSHVKIVFRLLLQKKKPRGPTAAPPYRGTPQRPTGPV